MRKIFFLKLCFLVSISHSMGFLEEPSTIQEPGHCVWYGQCGQGWNRGVLNCPATNVTRQAPRLTDPDALQILQDLCPSLYNGPDSTYTCCAGDQLKTMAASMSLPSGLLASCPACYYNFLNQICQMTCSPHQSKFTYANMSAPYPPGVSKHDGVPSLTYTVTNSYAQGLLDSCKDVTSFLGVKSLSIMCGHEISKCTPQNWLEFMGSTNNGQAPFPVNYVFSDTKWSLPDGTEMDPLNITNVRCAQDVPFSSPKISAGPCPCKDCPSAKSCHPAPKPIAQTRKQYLDSVFGAGQYMAVELTISRVDSKAPVKHTNPPPRSGYLNFTSMYDKHFMEQVLLLQKTIANLTAVVKSEGRSITLDNVCNKLTNQKACVIESPLQYYQNNQSKVERVVMDEFGFYTLADYLDHFTSCSMFPTLTKDKTALNMSCKPEFGNVTQPYMVLQGYKGEAYENATSFVMTFVLKPAIAPNTDSDVWVQKFREFMTTYNNTNMSVSFTVNGLMSNIQADPLNLISVDQLGASIPVQVGGVNEKAGPGYEIVQSDDVSPDDELNDEYADDVNDTGHCVWYGQCGPGYNGGKLNCAATNKTRNSPLLTDPKALNILQKYCTKLYNGPNNTRTCCDLAQLQTLQDNMDLPEQLLTRCPACYTNFLNQICQMTCSPIQSKFLWANTTCPPNFPGGKCDGVPSVTMIVTEQFAQGLYNSCKDVMMPAANSKAMSVLCGRTAEKCSPNIWLNYMGAVSNSRAPFPIGYVFQDTPWVSHNRTLTPLNQTNRRCNETLTNNSRNISAGPCLCNDCPSAKTCLPAPKPTAQTRKQYLDSMLGAGQYMAVELIIARVDSKAPVFHPNPPSFPGGVDFTSMYDKHFMKQVLLLQGKIANLTAVVKSEGRTITLDNVCNKLTNQNACVIESPMQYYQNNQSKVERVVMDEYGFYTLADYLDHFKACSRFPTLTLDGTALKMSCRPEFGNVTQPYMVLQGYKGEAYENATSFVMTFVLKQSAAPNTDSDVWVQKFRDFMTSYNNTNMSVSYTVNGLISNIQADPLNLISVDQLGASIPVQVGGVNEKAGPGYEIVQSDDVSPDDELNDEYSDDVNDTGHCVWYGQCGSGYNGGMLNCAATNKTRNSPLLTDPKALNIMQKYCTKLYNGPNNTRTCCDLAQLQTLQDNMDLPEQLLTRCPACYTNFLNQICQMTCSPIQSKFLWANTTCPPNFPGGKCDGVPSVTMIVTEQFAQGLYDSCKDVMMPAANSKAMSVLCGRTAEKCSPNIWLNYMGAVSNSRAPFPIGYVFQDTPWVSHNRTLTPLNQTNVRCNETLTNSSFPCSCQDCQISCAAVPPTPPPKKPFKILGIDGPTFIMSCCFLAFVIFFGTYVICYNIVRKNSLNVDNYNQTMNSIESLEQDCCDSYSINGSQANLITYQVSPADIGGFEKLGAKIEAGLTSVFTKWGTLCASYPLIVLLVGVIIFGSLAGGIARYDVTTDPVKLWSAPTSTAREQKKYFDSHFGPFYRTQQIIISRPDNHTKVNHPNPPPTPGSIDFSCMFDMDFMHQVLDLQLTVQNLIVPYEGENITLRDICFKPLSPDNEECTVESVLQYWQNNKTQLDKKVMDEYGFYVLADYLDHFQKCVQAPASVSDSTKLNMTCLASYGGPAFPWVVLGGYDDLNYLNATAFVITFVVNNHLDEAKNSKAEAWEAAFIKFMKSYKNTNMTISFSSQRSIQDELNRESVSDIFTIVASYLIMFGYITIALGQFRGVDTIFIDSKVTLGLSGVTIVLLSVAASVGFYSYSNVAMTLIIIEVVPFLVLAVGVDNIFILVQTYQRDVRKPNESLEEQIGRVLGVVGPSMLLTSFSESIAFFLGALTDMPAVREFALYAAMAVLFDFILQITCFISLMTIDARRQESNRFDLACCVKLPKKEKQAKSEGYLYWLVNNYFSHAILAQWVRPIVMVVFVGVFFSSIALACHLELGLDQALSMPMDSYVLDYFHNLTAYLSVGAPLYFVIPGGYNYTSLVGQNAICGSKGCMQDSLVGQVFHSSQIPNYSYVAQPASSWLDDYFDWLSNEKCCRLYDSNGTFCPASSKAKCSPCPIHQVDNRPTQEDFLKYIPMFLVDNPGLQCAKGGHAAYGAGVNLMKETHGNKTKVTNVGATYFMTYHTPMKTSADYINGLKEAREISKNISLSMNLTGDQEVFPYSIFYVFYEQYLDLVHQTMKNIGICMAAIFVVTFILLGFDLVTALVVLVTVTMIVVDIMGMMYLWDISLNALSLVNLVMAIGISVEFCSHIARAFAVSIEATRILRAKDALAHMGSSVLSGITLTKLVGIVILAFAKSQLFQVFYFRMYLGMVIFGATHGLIFLPVFLSYFGPGINKAKLYQHQQNQIRDRQSSKLQQNNKEDTSAVSNSYRRTDTEEPPSYNVI